jgi:hypothetical protein
MRCQKISVLLQVFMLARGPSSCHRLHVGSIFAPPDRLIRRAFPLVAGARYQRYLPIFESWIPRTSDASAGKPRARGTIC